MTHATARVLPDYHPLAARELSPSRHTFLGGTAAHPVRGSQSYPAHHRGGRREARLTQIFSSLGPGRTCRGKLASSCTSPQSHTCERSALRKPRGRPRRTRCPTSRLEYYTVARRSTALADGTIESRRSWCTPTIARQSRPHTRDPLTRPFVTFSIDRASPKSAIISRPSLLMSRLAAFMSRCKMPFCHIVSPAHRGEGRRT